MVDSSNPERLDASVQRLFNKACGSVFFLSTLVLILGWGLNVAFLTNLIPNWPTMKPITAAGCMLITTALFSSNKPKHKKFSLITTVFLILLSSASTLDTLLHTNLFPKTSLFSLPSEATAICLVVMGTAVLAIHLRHYFIAGLLAWSCLVLVIFRLLRLFLEGPQASYESIFDSMAIHTALFLLVLAAVGVLLHPKLSYHQLFLAPDTLGIYARWGIVLILLLPISLIVLVLRFSSIQHANLESLLAISVTLMSIFFVVMYHRMLQELKDRDTERQELVNQLQTMMDVAPSGILLVGGNGAIHHANPAITNMFGYNEEELLHTSVDLLVPNINRDGHSNLRQGYIKHPSVRNMGSGRSLFAQRKDGSLFDVEVSLAPMYLKDELFIHTQVVDITTRKAMELEQKKLTEKLSTSNAELQRFAYVASHDLRAPLRRISGFIQLLQTNYKGKLDEQADQWINRSVDNLERMQEMIDGLLRLSRISSEAEPYEPVSLKAIAEKVSELLSEQIQQAGAKLEIDDELPTVNADRAQMLTLFENLMGNAIKYSDTEHPFIRVHLHEQSERHTIIAVSDNGIGIEASDLDKVFEIFKRLHSYHQYEGNGIGLALCKRIIEKHNGKIWCESTIGKGSTFYIQLPII